MISNDAANDESICRGDWTDSYGLVSSNTVLPDIVADNIHLVGGF